jgi:predicted ATPase/DNA-binding CsgD family transcriptional regulator
VLVVTEDADHAHSAVATLAELLNDSPRSRLLATAARPLRIPGEHLLRLQTLAPPNQGAITVEEIGMAPAVALFCDRASAVDATFRLDSTNAHAIAELCGRLDGLPLALELAAARLPALPPASQLDLLSAGTSLDLRPLANHHRQRRHSELRTSIAWSHRLLGEPERIVFRRMAVFEGPVPLDILRRVCADSAWHESELFDALAKLVDIHLVEPERYGSDLRYRLLPTIADFARERLAEAAEASMVTARHCDVFAAIARDEAERNQLDYEARIAPYAADLHAALQSLVERDDAARGLQLCCDLAPLWRRRGFPPAPRMWFERMQAASTEADVASSLRATGLLWRAVLALEEPGGRAVADLEDRLTAAVALARESSSQRTLLFALSCVVLTVFHTRDLAGAARAAREGLQLARSTDDDAWLARFACWVAMAAQQVGDFSTATRLGAESLERARRRGDKATVVRVSMMLLALPADTPGLPELVPSLETLLRICREVDDMVGESWVCSRLTFRDLRAGDSAGAATWASEALRIAHRTGALSSGGFAIVGLATMAALAGDDLTAAGLHGSIAPSLQTLAVGLSAGPSSDYQAVMVRVRDRLGAKVFDAIAAESALKPWDDAVAIALDYAQSIAGRSGPPVRPRAGAPGKVADDQIAVLTPRELDVLRLLAVGDSNKEIGSALGLTPKTVMHHSVSIYGKLGLRGRAEAAAWAYRNGVAAEVVTA